MQSPNKILKMVPMPFDFTITKFRAICTAIAENYHNLTLAEYFHGDNPPERFVMMRHDIDRKPGIDSYMKRTIMKYSGESKINVVINNNSE
jgi:hypothetical protein